MTPCRVADTRDPAGPYGGPVLQSGSSRLFTIPGRCGIPATARSVFFNVTAVAATASGHLTLHPGDVPPPLASTLNFGPGQARANNAVLRLASDGSGTLGASPFVQGAGQVHAILDVTGYFQESILNGIFVSSTAGSPGGDGSSGNPVNTIGGGIALAMARGLSNVVIDGGDYVESVTLANGLALRGGFNSGSGWIRDGSPTRVAGGTTAVFGNNVSDVLLESLQVTAADNGAAGGSSYGVRLVGSSNIRILGSIIRAGRGGAGASGSSPGGSAANGGDGSLGMPGCENSAGVCSTCAQPTGGPAGASPCGRRGGDGGSAGLGSMAGSSGNPGTVGTPGGPGTPSLQGNWNTPATYWGQNGAPGSPGADGAPGSSSYAGSGYVPTNGVSGVGGQPGNGGGGGGGGGGGTLGCDSYGGGGGGGGGGGCGGTGASGGTSGGGSFAISLWASSLQMQNCQVRTMGGGGAGGDGGTGQSPGGGGQGGSNPSLSGAGNLYGASAQDDGSNGGRGGNGGSGGRGGHGGGGAGGPSIGILVGGGSNLMASSNTFQLAPPGAGGASAGNPGPAGLQANVHTP